jgi:hypothetical protein
MEDHSDKKLCSPCMQYPRARSYSDLCTTAEEGCERCSTILQGIQYFGGDKYDYCKVQKYGTLLAFCSEYGGDMTDYWWPSVAVDFYTTKGTYTPIANDGSKTLLCT